MLLTTCVMCQYIQVCVYALVVTVILLGTFVSSVWFACILHARLLVTEFGNLEIITLLHVCMVVSEN